VDCVFQSKSGVKITQVPQERFLYGHILDGPDILDEVIVRRKESDRIYGTRAVHIGCHGGGAAANAIINLLCRKGAALRDPEYALEHAAACGRISRVELAAHKALKNCVSELALPALVGELHEHLLERELVRIYCLFEKDSEAATGALQELLERNWALPLADPRSVVIAGYPNVGKSSLFNAIADKERVIVHHTPGTTRDVVDMLVVSDGVPFHLLDSAGLGEAKSSIEKQAEEFALGALGSASLILFVFDNSRAAKEREIEIYNSLDSKRLIPIINKTDLPRAKAPPVPQALEVSALTGAGIEKLRHGITRRLAGKPAGGKGPVVFLDNQERALKAALAAGQAGKACAAAEVVAELLGHIPAPGDSKADLCGL